MVNQMLEVLVHCWLLLVCSNGVQVLEGGREVRVDGRATDGVVAKSIHRSSESEIHDKVHQEKSNH